jgi:hypothetical protein
MAAGAAIGATYQGATDHGPCDDGGAGAAGQSGEDRIVIRTIDVTAYFTCIIAFVIAVALVLAWAGLLGTPIMLRPA